eukprot:TRINITY_DN66674_c5_g11_i4.p2 TRINITY_DN66674_c5_g11~~TRINITY_DN66674_c5_g11_i4.p2  ORF type:complete len:172 (+),score=108.00 TRINITY_DN66674_c5_g11_i4:111-626(+)
MVELQQQGKREFDALMENKSQVEAFINESPAEVAAPDWAAWRARLGDDKLIDRCQKVWEEMEKKNDFFGVDYEMAQEDAAFEQSLKDFEATRQANIETLKEKMAEMVYWRREWRKEKAELPTLTLEQLMAKFEKYPAFRKDMEDSAWNDEWANPPEGHGDVTQWPEGQKPH